MKKNFKINKNYPALFIAALSFCLISAGCNKFSPAEEEIDAWGNFEADEVVLSSLASGQIIKMDFDKGDKVKKDQMLAVIDTTGISLKIQMAHEKLKAVKNKVLVLGEKEESIQIEIENLTTEKQRLEKLVSGNAAPKAELDKVEFALKKAKKQKSALKVEKDGLQSEINSANLNILSLEDKLNKCFVTSPIDGTIIQSFNNTGENTLPGKPLFKIANLNKAILKAYISGNMLPEIKLGDTISVFCDSGTGNKVLKKFNGVITEIAENAEFTPKIIQTREERVNLVYAVEAEVVNDGTIKIGMPGEMKF